MAPEGVREHPVRSRVRKMVAMCACSSRRARHEPILDPVPVGDVDQGALLAIGTRCRPEEREAIQQPALGAVLGADAVLGVAVPGGRRCATPPPAGARPRGA